MLSDTSSFKVGYFTFAVIISIITAHYAHDMLASNQEALNLITTLLSFLSGFLITVITYAGDPRSFPTGSWRIAQLAKGSIHSRMHRLNNLFILYIVTLCLILVFYLLKTSGFKHIHTIQYIFTGMATFCILISLTLPSSLSNIQKFKLEDEIQKRAKSELSEGHQ